MTKDQAKLGVEVVSKVDFAGVPKGTEGVIDELYNGGQMVCWNLPYNFKPLRDGFADSELFLLDVKGKGGLYE